MLKQSALRSHGKPGPVPGWPQDVPRMIPGRPQGCPRIHPAYPDPESTHDPNRIYPESIQNPARIRPESIQNPLRVSTHLMLSPSAWSAARSWAFWVEAAGFNCSVHPERRRPGLRPSHAVHFLLLDNKTRNSLPRQAWDGLGRGVVQGRITLPTHKLEHPSDS